MDFNVSSRRSRSIAAVCFGLLLLGALICFWSYPNFLIMRNFRVVGIASDSKQQEQQTRIESIARSSNFSVEELWNLDQVLRNATIKNTSTVILTPLNQAWAAPGSMLDYLFESFRSGENTSKFLDSLVIVALDQVAFERCLVIHRHCFQLRTQGVDFSGEKFFMTDDYLKMTRRKVSFLAVVLELGYSLVFTDGDLLWFRDPFPHFSQEAEFEVSCDRFNGDEASLHNGPNTGFLHVKSSNRTVEMFKLWHNATEIHAESHDQDVFNQIKFSDEFQRIGARIRFLPSRIFSSFCERPDDLESFCTMHANCCVGLHAKMEDLRLVLDDWKRFEAQTLGERRSDQSRVWFRAPDACKRSW
ncbi:uncharacterized protein At4g15970-like [Selaginella moellendorffii]|uniref:uncharacterized protein At4g15970-like n=1 Tax=Selaginella moellendorffii TaxID=88036 RepID=UPI000D1C5DF7|nr:uncharacterized protein At4g15970-like [Selaginella moellendorffii]|eukprot:XP_024516073.1 uncharacterized protein At4g15970-like [Selaginella moellendorffii]